MLNVTVAGSSAVQQSNNSITAGLISNQPNEMKSIEQAMASTSFFSPKVQNQNQSFGKSQISRFISVGKQLPLPSSQQNW
jgi:hypothetical protein